MIISKISSPIVSVWSELEKNYGSNLLNYGEAVQSLSDNQGGNYTSVNNQTYCSVDDNFETVIFFVRESASANPEAAGGNMRTLTRSVSWKLICNSKLVDSEFIMSTILNSIAGIQYNGSSYNAKSVASSYFGLSDYNFETQFFSIDFTAIERISCIPTCRR